MFAMLIVVLKGNVALEETQNTMNVHCISNPETTDL